MMDLIVEPRADRDLDEASIYILETSSEERAFRFLDAASTTFREIAEMPERGIVYPFQNQSLPVLRRWFVRDFRDYLIFY